MSIGRRVSSVVSFSRSPLLWLCLAQACERFALLSVLPLFAPFVQERHGIATPTALMMLSVFHAVSYLGGLPGGWLIDRRLGPRAASVLGSLLLLAGYFCMTDGRRAALWAALAFFVAGHALFRPGLHSRIAASNDADHHARSRGFLWHYLAANLGYAAGALFAEWARARHGWAGVFAGAVAASTVAVLTLLCGPSSPQCRTTPRSGIATEDVGDATPRSLRAVWLLCGVAVIFWLTAQQAASTLTVFAAEHITREITLVGRAIVIGPGHFAALHGGMVITLLPAFLFLQYPKRVRRSDGVALILWGLVATAAAFAVMTAACLRGGDVGRVEAAWLVVCYALLSVAEILLAPLGVSLITRLAPRSKAAQAVGLWFAGSAVGNGLAAALALLWNRWPHHRYFGALTLLSLGAAALLVQRRRTMQII